LPGAPAGRRGGTVVRYRTFRNTDPPRLVEVWNETFTGRGAVRLISSTPLERFVFSKPLFDPQGLFVAEEDDCCLGFAHAGFGPPGPDGPADGIVCLLGVRPAFRRRGVGTELLRLCEEYLLCRNARRVFAGGHWPDSPFYMGLYGGSGSPGFLRSDPLAEPFFLRHGYRVDHQFLVMQRALDQPFKLFDPRFLTLRQRFDLRVDYPRTLRGWWRECVIGYLDPLEFVLVEQQSGEPAARTLIWDMESFTLRWRHSAVGILDFEVLPNYRRQGLGKLFLSYLMRQVQEQFFQVVELHLHESNQQALRFLQGLGFEHVDTGQVFLRQTPG
jgi:ribosomal protein S18 acetylase RimI-like enzyme